MTMLKGPMDDGKGEYIALVSVISLHDENSAKFRRIDCNVTEQCSRTLGRSFMHVNREQKLPKD